MRYIDLEKMGEPKVGKIYVTKLDQVYSAIYSDEEKCFKINADIGILDDPQEFIDPPVTLIKYVGDGIFEEYYTKLPLRFAQINQEESSEQQFSEANFFSKNSFCKKYGTTQTCNVYDAHTELKNIPLLLANFGEIEKEALGQIGYQLGIMIEAKIKEARNRALRILGASLNGIIKECTNVAYGENLLYDFQNGINRTRKIDITDKKQ